MNAKIKAKADPVFPFSRLLAFIRGQFSLSFCNWQPGLNGVSSVYLSYSFSTNLFRPFFASFYLFPENCGKVSRNYVKLLTKIT